MSNLEVEIQTLTEALIFEMTKALALPQTRQAKRVIRMIFGKAARTLRGTGGGTRSRGGRGRRGCRAHVGLYRALLKATRRAAQRSSRQKDPLVIAANHPAAVDSLVISAHVERPDYKIIVGDIPFFENLPHLSQHAIYAPGPQDIHGRMRVIRESIRHLTSGGSLVDLSPRRHRSRPRMDAKSRWRI